jgi:phosphoesterase RecJ-like protein
MKNINLIYPELCDPKKVVITMHQKPDGDAMGSTLGLYHFLIQFGHEVNVISPTNWADFLKWMPGCTTVLDYEKESKKSDVLIETMGSIFV